MQCQQCTSWECPEPVVWKSACNSIVVKIFITPQFDFDANNANSSLQQISIENAGVTVTKAEVQQSQSINGGPAVVVYADYTRDLLHEQLLVINLGQFNQRNIRLNSSVPLLLYSEDECEGEEIVQSVVKGVQGASYFVALLALLTGKIVGLELFGVLQLAYFALGSYTSLDIYLAPLVEFKKSNGFSVDFLLSNVPTSSILQFIGVNSSFLNNVNVMLFVMIGVTLIIYSLYLLAGCCWTQKTKDSILTFAVQCAITLVMFLTYVVGYSLGVHFSYS